MFCYLYDMGCFSYPVINIEETSLRLKALREQSNVSVNTLQKLFSFNYPQAIYKWENPKDKTLPCLDNLIVLAKLYKVSIDELIVTKNVRSEVLQVQEQNPMYGISKESLEFIRGNVSQKVRIALSKFYYFDLL